MSQVRQIPSLPDDVAPIWKSGPAGRQAVPAGPYWRKRVRSLRPQQEEVPVSFASGPGRDDGGLPPVNIVIPDDARDLDRDVLAYRRELRAKRRRQRIMRLFGPLNRRGLGGQAAILPLIATCVALSMLAGAMLSVMTISPAKAPTVSNPQAAAGTPPGLTELPAGNVRIDSEAVPARNLVSSALALIPAGCDCGPALRRLADQATEAQVSLYFVASGSAMPQLADLTAQYGGGAALAVYDADNLLGAAYHPAGLTVLLVYSDATALVRTNLPAGFQLTSALRELTRPGR